MRPNIFATIFCIWWLRKWGQTQFCHTALLPPIYCSLEPGAVDRWTELTVDTTLKHIGISVTSDIGHQENVLGDTNQKRRLFKQSRPNTFRLRSIESLRDTAKSESTFWKCPGAANEIHGQLCLALIRFFGLLDVGPSEGSSHKSLNSTFINYLLHTDLSDTTYP